MAFHYSPTTAKLLLRQLAEQHQQRQADVELRQRVRISAKALHVICELLGEVHAAGGSKLIDYATYAFANFEQNADNYSKSVGVGVALGLFEQPEPRKVPNPTGYATTGMLVTLAAGGRQLIAFAKTEQGIAQACDYAAANRKRMDRKSRSSDPTASRAHADDMPTSASKTPNGRHEANDSHPLGKPLPPFRQNDSHPLGADFDLRGGLLRDSKTQEREFKEKEELSAAQSAAHPVQRGKSLLIIETAVSQFDACQKQHDGIRTDGWTVESLMQQTVGWSDEQVAQACGVALHLSRAWAWSQGRPSACPAGETIGAVIKGTAWSPVPGVTCTSDVAERFSWDDANQTFVDSVGMDLFDREIQPLVPMTAEAPSALDREGDCSPVSVTLSETPVEASTPVEAVAVSSTAPCPVEAVSSPVQPFALVPPPKTTPVPGETRKTSVGMNQRQVEDARNAALAAFKASQFHNTFPSTGRYGTPVNSTADCGEEYFASIQRSNTAVLERDDEDLDF